LIVAFSRDVTEQKRLELRSRQNGRNLTESQRFANPGSTAMDVTEGTKIEEALKRRKRTPLFLALVRHRPAPGSSRIQTHVHDLLVTAFASVRALDRDGISSTRPPPFGILHVIRC
jgi:hypothetical protein